MADLLRDDRLHDIGAGNVHVAVVLHHEDPVRERRRVNGAPRRGPHDGGDLGNIAGRNAVAVEDPGISLQRGNAFLDARPTGIVQRNERLPRLDGHVHRLADFLGVHLPKAASGAGEILGGDEDNPAVDLAKAGDDAIRIDLLPGKAKEGGSMFDKKLDLLKSSLIEKEIEPFPGRQFSLLMLLSDHLFAAHGADPVFPF